MITSNMSLSKVASAARKDVGQLQRHVAGKHADLVAASLKVHGAEPIVRYGTFTSEKRLQWMYVVSAQAGRVTLYPLLWYATSEGVNALQIDAVGPATYFQPHVLDRYIKRYMRSGDLYDALRVFHKHNYAKVCLPYTYKGDRENYAAVIDDGYVAGEYLKEDAIVHFRTFYNKKMGRKRFGHLRFALGWQRVLGALTVVHNGRRDTPHVAWCRGYVLRMDTWREAA